jgi:2-polyprenyl-6-methoxyphenol hydroxylase-like FAD-dependent oxidoreductase
MKSTDVLIIGAGPFGLMLAIELGRRNIKALVMDKKQTTAFNPQANATQARTMEYFRRLGFAEEIRELGLPQEYPTDIAYYTRFAMDELGRFELPSASDAAKKILSNSGSWTAAEAPHRVSQKFVERVLLKYAQECASIDVSFSTQLLEFEQSNDYVVASYKHQKSSSPKQIKAKFLIGADGAQSLVRRSLKKKLEGEFGKKRHFMGGRMYAVYLQCEDFYRVTKTKPAWMHWTFNQNRRAFMAAVDGLGEFAFHTQLSEQEREDQITDDTAKRLFWEAVGVEIECQILSHMPWTAGHAAVSNSFIEGRVLIGGDAAHLFTPTGGLGYNTAVEDAVNLGWKISHVIEGQASENLLQSYEYERRQTALRNTQYARKFADSIGDFIPHDDIESQNKAGIEQRKIAAKYLVDHAKKEFNIPGITFGARYDGSPILPQNDVGKITDSANEYKQSPIPGGRAPHFWLSETESIYDKFGFNWTLIRFRPISDSADTIIEESKNRGLDLKILNIENQEIKKFYDANLIVIRPDQIVAWRGNTSEGFDWDLLLGNLI